MARIDELVVQANQLANAGRWQEAESLWREVHSLNPGHLQALFSLGVHALRRADYTQALQLLDAARVVAPTDTLVLLTLAGLQRELGSPEREIEALDAALAVNPYYLPAMLARGSWFERHHGRKAAAPIYANALKIAPPAERLPPEIKESCGHARRIVEAHSRDLHEHLNRDLAPSLAAMTHGAAGRWREAAAVMSGLSKPYHSESNQLCVPRLPAMPFYDREAFPWLDALEAGTSVIRNELEALLASDPERFGPYIAYRPGEPVNQWRELNHSTRWSSLHLWRSGAPVEHNLAGCPDTARILASLPMADIEGLCPNVMFSVLAPKTHIPPHNGETNARLIVHLPLIVPDGCVFRVGFEERRWEMGKCLIFDDTIEHEARNDSDEVRVVLIFDIWNPCIPDEERQLVRTLAASAREFARL